MLRASSIVIACAVAFLDAQDAAACVCIGDALVSPPDGAVNVPLEIDIHVLGSFWSGPFVLVAGGVEVAELEEVAFEGSRDGTLRRLLVPQGTLEPDTLYTLRRDGDSRETTFRTGTQSDLQPPPPPVINSWRLAHASWVDGANSSCGDERMDVELDVAASDDLGMYEAVVSGPGLDRSYVLFPPELTRLGAYSCDVWLVAPRGEETCVTLRARDLAGNLSDPTTACATTRECEALDPAASERIPSILDCEEVSWHGCSAGGSASASTGLLVLAALGLISAARGRRRAPLVLLGAFVALADAGEADACSCGDSELQSPADGDVGVPLNAEILRAGTRGAWPATLSTGGVEVATISPEPLREGSGIALGRFVIPPGTLQSETTYTIAFTIEPGVGTSTTFETGSSEDLEAPATPSIAAWRLAYAPWLDGVVSSCGPARMDIDLQVTPDPDAVAYEATFVGPELELSYVLLAQELSWLGASECGIWFLAPRPEEYCVTLRARDLAGNLSEPVTACATTRYCEPIDPDDLDPLFDCVEAPAPVDPEPGVWPEDESGCNATQGAGAPTGLLVLVALALVSSRYAFRARPRVRRARYSAGDAPVQRRNARVKFGGSE